MGPHNVSERSRLIRRNSSREEDRTRAIGARHRPSRFFATDFTYGPMPNIALETRSHDRVLKREASRSPVAASANISFATKRVKAADADTKGLGSTQIEPRPRATSITPTFHGPSERPSKPFYAPPKYDHQIPPQIDTLNGRTYYRKSDADSTLFIDRTPRPIQEPPVFDYEWIIEEDGFLEELEKEHDKMYEPDITFKTDRIDLILEHELLSDYRDWLWAISPSKHDPNPPLSDQEARKRKEFYDDLGLDIGIELLDVKREMYVHDQTKLTKAEIGRKKRAEEAGAPDPGREELFTNPRFRGISTLTVWVRERRWQKKVRDVERGVREWSSEEEEPEFGALSKEELLGDYFAG